MSLVKKIKKTRRSLSLFLVAVVLSLSAIMTIHPVTSSAIGNGWANPLGPMVPISAGFLANGCGKPGYDDYLPGRYHIANDYGAAAGANVYSIGAGRVVEVQTGWPGSAVYIRHTAADGTPFLGVYGHLSSAIGSGGRTVHKGQIVGQVLDQGGNSHLHFGIRNATAAAPTNNGAMSCSSWPNSNGYVDPVPYLTDHGATLPTPPPPPPPPTPPPPRPAPTPPPPAPPKTPPPPPAPNAPPAQQLPLSTLDCRSAINKRPEAVAIPFGPATHCGIPFF